MSAKTKLRNARKRCGYCGSRGPFQKAALGRPRKPYHKKQDRCRHIWLCLRCRI